ILRHVAVATARAAVDHRQAQMGASIADVARKALTFLQQSTCLVEPGADAPTHVEELHASGDTERRGVAVVRYLTQELTHLAPVMGRGGEVGAAHPLGGAPVPARGAERVAGLLPMVRQQRGAFVEVLG